MRRFTYCRLGAYATPVGVEGAQDVPLGLLFGTDEVGEVISDAALDELLVDEEIQRVFPLGVTATRVELRDDEPGVLLVSPSARFNGESWEAPDDANESTPKYLVGVGHQVFEYSPLDRYGACTSLFKYLGCEKCELRGYPCVQEAIPFLPEGNGINNSVDTRPKLVRWGSPRINDFLNYKHGVTKIGSFTFSKPSLTYRWGKRATLRGWQSHSFRVEEANLKDRETTTERTRKSASQAKFELTQCRRCFVEGSCSRPVRRECTGAYRSEEFVRADILEGAKELFQTNLTEEQLWRVMSKLSLDDGSYTGYAIGWREKQWRLLRIKEWQIERQDIDTYSEMRDILGIDENAVIEKPPDKIRALFYSVVKNSAEYDARWFWSVRDDKVHTLTTTSYGSIWTTTYDSLLEVYQIKNSLPYTPRGNYRPPPTEQT